MSELPTPTASRLGRPSWRDSRLVVGVLLVLLATVLGARVFAAADDTVPMFVAAQPLKPGDRLTASNLRRVDVQLGDSTTTYLSASTGVPADGWVRRSVPQGELVPSAAVGGRSDVGVQAVSVKVDATSVTGLAVGSVVDVWVSPRDPATTQERYLDAQRLLEGVSVASVPTDRTTFGAASGTAAVQLLVPGDRVGMVIGAMDKLSRVTLVPVAGSSSPS